MRWSKLRQRTLANISPDIRERVDFHVTMYRDSHDSDYGRAWITIDGEQVASWSCFEQLLSPLLSDDAFRKDKWWTDDYDRMAAELGVYSKKDFVAILKEYLNGDPHSLLQAKVPLARALAVADKRVGKRTLRQFSVNEEDDPLVLLFYALRMSKLVAALQTDSEHDR